MIPCWGRTQKQITSSNLNKTMEDVEKDVIPVSSTKQNHFWEYTFPFHGDIEAKNMIHYY